MKTSVFTGLLIGPSEYWRLLDVASGKSTMASAFTLPSRQSSASVVFRRV